MACRICQMCLYYVRRTTAVRTVISNAAVHRPPAQLYCQELIQRTKVLRNTPATAATTTTTEAVYGYSHGSVKHCRLQ